jgi:hypothetical protein
VKLIEANFRTSDIKDNLMVQAGKLENLYASTGNTDILDIIGELAVVIEAFKFIKF